jgi:hypothetical protein
MIEVDNNRTLYTGHGQHLNSRGKESMANKIASTIKCMLAMKTEPISAKWYLDNETPETPTPTKNDQDSTAPRKKDPDIENEHTGTQNLEIPTNAEVEHKTAVRASNREKKIPATRNEDFLWPTYT